MANPDYSRLKSTLANSKVQADNNALYQTILGTIDAAQNSNDSLSSALAALQGIIDSITAPKIVEIDCSGGPVSVEMTDYITTQLQLVIFKDITGNAGANTITLTGTVEGAVDPTITTNYGTYQAFLGTDGDFHTW